MCWFFIDERISLSLPENPPFGPPPLNIEPQTPTPFVVEPFPPPQAQPAAPAPKAGENPVWSGWDVLQITGLTLLTLFVVQLLVVLGARQFAYPRESLFDVAQKPVLALLSELLTYVAVALYMILLVQGKYRTSFWPAIRWNWPGMVAVSFLGLGVLMLGLDLLGRFLPMPKETP